MSSSVSGFCADSSSLGRIAPLAEGSAVGPLASVVEFSTGVVLEASCRELLVV